ncbi:hypothetical protein [Pseudoalteromonas prydzensis]|uniref:hypothetical protein n=1 Tax=Pseudoalteromonas prydzensis TaxID=182141 RepID=UPI003FCFC207
MNIIHIILQFTANLIPFLSLEPDNNALIYNILHYTYTIDVLSLMLGLSVAIICVGVLRSLTDQNPNAARNAYWYGYSSSKKATLTTTGISMLFCSMMITVAMFKSASAHVAVVDKSYRDTLYFELKYADQC